MSRATNRVPSRNRRRAIVKSAAGHRGRKSKCYRIANRSVEKGMLYQYRDRKNVKREFRSLWIIRINAFAREVGLTYSSLIDKLAKSDLQINRKMLVSCINADSTSFKDMLHVRGIV